MDLYSVQRNLTEVTLSDEREASCRRTVPNYPQECRKILTLAWLHESWGDEVSYSSKVANVVYGFNNPLYYDEHGLSSSVQSSAQEYKLQSNSEEWCRSLALDDWRSIPVKNWKSVEILHWINEEARMLDVCCTGISGEKFAQFDGAQLLSLSLQEFQAYDPNYGKILYERLHRLAKSIPNKPTYNQYAVDEDSSERSYRELDKPSSLPLETHSYPHDTDSQPSNTLSNLEERIEKKRPNNFPPEKKRPGRPRGTKRKKKPEKLGRLWEFIRDLLKNKEYCPSLIAWDNYEEGMFRFVHSAKVAQLWGSKKDNKDMNYEKLSRAMRYYYKSKVLLPVLGRRLVYKFGPTATGWRVDNPNFKH